ncbi:hypothetical protein H310_08712 [Aphanomyces invadans]|uniref:Beta-lactamase-related domain-containing protein n=1 Tax=Aphanomyces invadans TaxID=157072 RepID=A0A024TZ14_9STRA|nr:hypothetical protein H310_08712 [Aphanomyces invadans]ETV98592.1 hypothetical protein H310_08712 [Aphanomyces invadans]|eukprot:XP_008872789.1 hypothetical protein H310_08712 [Aphanomyces invadans]
MLRRLLLATLVATAIHGVRFDDRVVWMPQAKLYVQDAATPSEDALSQAIAACDLTCIKDKVTRTIAFVHRQMSTFPAPGLALSVVYANRTVLAQGFGLAEHGNRKAVVTPHTLFEVGSFSKTFVAVAIAVLVDEGKLTWTDSVQQHLPWFEFADAYATQFTTLADLAAMNSVLGDYEGDDVIATGVYLTEKNLVHALRHLNTTRQVRPGYAYSNLNYEILGQVIEAVTNQPWHEYMRRAIWTPLGMTNTVGRAQDSRSSISGGHFHCNGQVLGPFDVTNSSRVMLRPGDHYAAAGSILSTAADLSKFSEFLMRKGGSLMKSPAVIADLITGHSVVPLPVEFATISGYEFVPDGDAVTAGYGFDVVGDIMHGHQYVDKGGDTFSFHTRTGWLPAHGVGVILVANAQSFTGRPRDMATIDLMRTYILGVFLDIPPAQLDRQFQASLAQVDKLFRPSACDPYFYQGIPWDIPGVTIPNATKAALVGTYHAVQSPAYYGAVVVSLNGTTLWMEYGVYKRRLIATLDSATLVWAVDMGDTTTTVTIADVDTARPRITYGVDFIRDL